MLGNMFNPLKPKEDTDLDISNVDSGPPPPRKWGLEITGGGEETGEDRQIDGGSKKIHWEDIPKSMDGWADSAGGVFSGAVTGAPFLLAAALIVALGLFYLYQRETSARVEKMEAAMTILTENLAQQKRKNMRAGMAMARAELARAIAALDRVISLKDPKLTRDALRLREEAKRAMVDLETAPLEQEGEPAAQEAPSQDSPVNAPADQPASEEVLTPEAPGSAAPEGAPASPGEAPAAGREPLEKAV